MSRAICPRMKVKREPEIATPVSKSKPERRAEIGMIFRIEIEIALVTPARQFDIVVFVGTVWRVVERQVWQSCKQC